jgi:hypothetical protein
MRLGIRSARKRWLWALAAVLLIGCGAGATVWVVRDTAGTGTSGNDCAVVEKLAGEWVTTTQQVKTALETGPGERSDLLAVADQESAMSAKLRAAANSVSAPAFKDQFNKWADGVAMTAQIQRESVNRPLQVEPPPDLEANMRNAALTTNQASGALLQACPDARKVLPGK